jgi:heme-degrading monooxygenase HmoA/catechol 2,3-dioxygenase-like lactoylglutathione lyase family enzyme
VIARTWKGAVRRRDGDAYARYMRQTGVAEYAQSPGNRGVWMLRRDVEDRTEFLMFTLWDSLEAVKGFAGEDYQRAVFYPEDDRFLVERDRTSTHYEVDTERRPGPATIGRLEKTVIDCPDPRALAAFYAELLGMRVNEDSDDWVVIGRVPGARELAFQRAPEFVPPQWPDPWHPQQLHLDIRVDDVDRAEQAVLALGARRLPAERESGFRVFADPVGHPFCLVFG